MSAGELPNAVSRLPPSFTLEQLTRSDTAMARHIDNQPLLAHLPNLRRLTATLEAIQTALRHPISVTSAYRCPELNHAVGGVSNSRHTLGLAADFTCASLGTPLRVAHAVIAAGIEFDQLIHEYGRWVHVGLAEQGSAPRRQVLTICAGGGGYRDGLLPCAAQQT